jgi:hypothetical protein
MAAMALSRFSEWLVLVFLVFAILWEGGEGMETTWLLAMISGFVTLRYWWLRKGKIQAKNQPLTWKHDLSSTRNNLPLTLWAMVLLLIFLTILSFAFSVMRTYGFDEVLETTSLLLLFLWIGRLHINNEDSILRRYFPRLLTGATLVAAAVGALIYVAQPSNRFAGTFLDISEYGFYWPNAWAEFLLAAWPV